MCSYRQRKADTAFVWDKSMAAASHSEEMSCLFVWCLFNDPPGTQSPPIQHTRVLPSPMGISKALICQLQTNSKKSSTIIIKTERRRSEPSGSNPNPQRGRYWAREFAYEKLLWLEAGCPSNPFKLSKSLRIHNWWVFHVEMIIRDGTVATRNEARKDAKQKRIRGKSELTEGVKVLKQWLSPHGQCRIRMH